ncbi:DUF4129 domain-containing protein [Natrialba swarupiae]|uniref:DUF4129 domain-containing protein n=1 Tax=Natrialba swarupiae TaxID=2448032 RepID=A0A5D5AS55_9EURY|nr:DUF4129 domain-containing protein [Natrialba swarupiae]TYT62330.1 hypothetical protein FYC77_08920 [Natrialba swarupiae]
MAGGSNAGRRLLAVIAVICAVGGLVLAASAMPMLAADAPVSGLTTEGGAIDDRHGPGAGAADGQTAYPGSGGTEAGGAHADAVSETPTDGSQIDGPQLDDRDLGPAETVAGGILYGLGTLFSALGGDDGADDLTGGDESLEDGAVADTDADSAAAESPDVDTDESAEDPTPADSGMGGEFGELLTGGDEPDGPAASADGAESTIEDAGDEAVPADDVDLDSSDDLAAGDEIATDADREDETSINDDVTTVDGEHADGLESEIEGEDGLESEIEGEDGLESVGDDTDPESTDGLESPDDLESNGDAGDDIDSSDAIDSAETVDADDPDRLEHDGDLGDEERSDGDVEGEEPGDGDEDSTAAGDSSGDGGSDGDSTLEDGTPDVSGTVLLLVGLALAVAIVGYLLYRSDDPIGTVLSIPSRIASFVVAGVVACSQALERAVAALRRVGSIRELPALVRATIGGLLESARTRTRNVGSSIGLFDEPEPEPADTRRDDEHASARERIERAFETVISASTFYRARVATATPTDVARSAKHAGAPTGPVETITDAFRDVEYGERDPEPYVDSADAARERLRNELESTGDDTASEDDE